MSEQKSPRPSTEVKQEYANLCLKAGNIQYAISQQKRDLENINTTLRDLNFEYMASEKYEADVAKAAKAALDTPKPELSVVKEG